MEERKRRSPRRCATLPENFKLNTSNFFHNFASGGGNHKGGARYWVSVRRQFLVPTPHALLRASSPNLSENAETRTLTLAGSNAGDNTFAWAINDLAGATMIHATK